MRFHSKKMRTCLGAALLALVGTTACADLEVLNEGAVNRDLALETPDDVEALVGGAHQLWWAQTQGVGQSAPIRANQAFMWSAFPANFGMVFYSSFPRAEIGNHVTAQFYGEMVQGHWVGIYRSAAVIAMGMQEVNNPATEIADALGPQRVARLNAYSRFMLGIVHLSAAQLYDRGFVIHADTDLADPGEPVPYPQLHQIGIAYLDEAIQLGNQGGFPALPDNWMWQSGIDGPRLAQIASSYKARFMADFARTPAQRAAVDWDGVIQAIDNGVGVQDDGFFMILNGNTTGGVRGHGIATYLAQIATTWAQASYMIIGMADQSGMYQDWLSDPIGDRHPNFPNADPRLIITPDQRFPQGETIAEHRANPGMPHSVTGSPHISVPPNSGWLNPERGPYRWSWYRHSSSDFFRPSGQRSTPIIMPVEMRLLRAEAFLHGNNPAAAAELINVSRVAAGLNATDAAGTNTSCVPRLPDGSCGDLMEMLKWEFRLEVMGFGNYANSWFYSGRGWGDLYERTPLHAPMPCQEIEVVFGVGSPCDTYGGTGDYAAAQSVYGALWQGGN